MENINNFLAAAGAYGVKSEDLFQTVALYEGSNMTQVCCYVFVFVFVLFFTYVFNLFFFLSPSKKRSC